MFTERYLDTIRPLHNASLSLTVTVGNYKQLAEFSQPNMAIVEKAGGVSLGLLKSYVSYQHVPLWYLPNQSLHGSIKSIIVNDRYVDFVIEF